MPSNPETAPGARHDYDLHEAHDDLEGASNEGAHSEVHFPESTQKEWSEKQKRQIEEIAKDKLKLIEKALDTDFLAGREYVFNEALDRVAQRHGLANEKLKHWIEDISSIPMDGSILPQDLRKILSDVTDEIFVVEDEKHMDELEIETSSVPKLIESLDVSDEQKNAWKELSTLEIPKSTKVLLLYVAGGKGLNMSGELDHLKDGLEGLHLDTPPKIVPLDNFKNTKQELFRRIEDAAKSGEYDLVIPYFSTHGITKSNESYELTESNAPDDTFYVVNEKSPSADSVFDSIQESEVEAERFVEAHRKEHPNAFEKKGNVRGKIRAGTVFTLGEKTVRIPYEVDSEYGLKEAISSHLRKEKQLEHHISTHDLLRLQSTLDPDGRIDFIYIFDNCFSGSATDDELAKHCKAILAASSEDQVASNTRGEKKRGLFMDRFFRKLAEGESIGDAFIYTDIISNYSKGVVRSRDNKRKWKDKHYQNPRASLRREDGTLLKVSSILNDKNFIQSMNSFGVDTMDA